MARKYGSAALPDDQKPEEELTSEEIARRILEKDAELKAYSERTGARVGPMPTAREVNAAHRPAPNPEALAQIERERADVQARVAQLDREIEQWKKQEVLEKQMAADETKRSRLELGRQQQEAQARLAEAQAATNLAAAEEIMATAATQAERNQAIKDQGSEPAREALRQRVQPWLHEVSFAQRRARELDQQYRRTLETFAGMVVADAPSEFPAQIKNQLSAKVYRRAEEALNLLNTFLAGSRDEPDHRGETLETVLQQIAVTGVYGGSIERLRRYSSPAYQRDMVAAIKSQIDILLSELARLYREGKEAAAVNASSDEPVPPSVPAELNPDRQQAKADLLNNYPAKSLQAVTGPILGDLPA